MQSPVHYQKFLLKLRSVKLGSSCLNTTGTCRPLNFVIPRISQSYI